MQESAPSRSRNPTERNSAARSPHNDRTAARLSGPGFRVTTRNIAARVSGADTGCARARKPSAALRALFGSGFIGCHPWRAHGISLFEMPRSPRVRRLRAEAYHRPARNVHAAVRLNARLGCVHVKPQPSEKKGRECSRPGDLLRADCCLRRSFVVELQADVEGVV